MSKILAGVWPKEFWSARISKLKKRRKKERCMFQTVTDIKRLSQDIRNGMKRETEFMAGKTKMYLENDLSGLIKALKRLISDL